ncbi:13754_t:CDS:2, partial [Entrophospora sp. SA101]
EAADKNARAYLQKFEKFHDPLEDVPSVILQKFGDNIAPVIELMAEPASKSHMKKLTISGMIKDTKEIYDSGGQCSTITYGKVKELGLVTDTDRIVSNITDQL